MSYVLSDLPGEDPRSFVMSHSNGHDDSAHVAQLTVNKSLKDIIVSIRRDIKKAHVPLTVARSMQF